MFNIDTNNDGHTRKGVGGDKKGFPETRGLENKTKKKMNERMNKDLARSPCTESSKDAFVYHI